jgi:hypothetical protein
MSNEQALQDFVSCINRANDLALSIMHALDNHLDVDPDAVNWGHAWSAAAIANSLAEICDQHKINTGAQ